MRFEFTIDEEMYTKSEILEKYDEWADALFNAGFSYSMSDLLKDLNVSRNWVNNELYPYVDTVKYTRRYIFEKFFNPHNIPRIDSQIYFNKNQINDFIKNNSTYSVQTRLVNAADYLNISEKELNYYMESFAIEYYSDPDDKDFCFKMNIPIADFKDWLNENYKLDLLKLDYTHRTLYETKKIDPIDFYSHKYKRVIANKHHYYNQELLYRDMFGSGAIKVSLGTKKTFFLVERIEPDENGEKRVKLAVPY